MDGVPNNIALSVEDVFMDFNGRRTALIKALSTDFQEFFRLCDPGKENLCLYGHPNEKWEVNLPAEEVPPELPEPALGINFARDGLPMMDWLSLVAVYSDAWLVSVAFYFGARFNFGKADRTRLYNMINDLPTIFEIVSGATQKQATRKPSKSKSNSKKKKSSKNRGMEEEEYEDGDEDEEEEEEDEGLDEKEGDQGETLCGACGDVYLSNEFWICCDMCERWFHGACVKITPARAEHIKQYKCPTCNNKRARP